MNDGDCKLGLLTIKQALDLLPVRIEERVFRAAAIMSKKNYSLGRSMTVHKDDILTIIKETEKIRRRSKPGRVGRKVSRTSNAIRGRSASRPEERIRPMASGPEKARAQLARIEREEAEAKAREAPPKKRRLMPKR